jgi:hypothetical protein
MIYIITVFITNDEYDIYKIYIFDIIDIIIIIIIVCKCNTVRF